MTARSRFLPGFGAALCAASAVTAVLPAHAAVAITEVAAWSSGNSPVAADWFELTNTGTAAIELAGWSMDDNSATAGVAALSGVTRLAAGQSVIFIEGNGSADAAFIATWFGANAPAGLVIGHYSGSGVGLGTGGDAVNVFDAAHVLQANVGFGASPSSAPFATFDNGAGLNGTISQLSVAGVHGAFVAAGDAAEIGSPGTIAAVPEPATWALMLAGIGLAGSLTRVRRAVLEA